MSLTLKQRENETVKKTVCPFGACERLLTHKIPLNNAKNKTVGRLDMRIPLVKQTSTNFDTFATNYEYSTNLLWLMPDDFTRQGRPLVGKVLK